MEEEEEDKVIEPRVTIGAQDIISLRTSSHNGFLRYEGSLERFVKTYVIFKPFFREAVKWRQRFVVLCESCMYLYKDEYSTSPMKAVSLANYNRIQRIEGNGVNDRRTRMSFELVSLDEGYKNMIFCCTSDDERKMWFQKIRKEMELAAHAPSDLRSDFDQEEYTSLELPVQSVSPSMVVQCVKNKAQVKEKNKGKQPVPKKALPPIPTSDADSDDDPTDDYDTITDEMLLPRALPKIPSQSADNRNTSGKGTRLKEPIKPKTAPKPRTKKDNRFAKTEFEYNSNDKDKAEEILENMSVGTFLVRKSRQDDQKVLSVRTDEGVKEYKIYNKDRGLSIDNKENWFSTTEELLNFYADHDIPHRVLTLSRGYSTTDMRF